MSDHCLYCGAYVDPADGDAVVRVVSDGVEVWCSEQHACAWVLAGELLLDGGEL